jgi:general stress protein 26
MPHRTDTERPAGFHEFIELLREFKHAMLVTHHGNDLRSRPMTIADCTDAGHLWFITSVDSAKLEELTDVPSANVSLQSGMRFLSISGTARASRDPERVRELWTIDQHLWFEKGLIDPELILLEIVPTYAEYWNRSGAKGLQFLFAEAGAALSGRRLSSDEEDHAKIPFPK